MSPGIHYGDIKKIAGNEKKTTISLGPFTKHKAIILPKNEWSP